MDVKKIKDFSLDYTRIILLHLLDDNQKIFENILRMNPEGENISKTDVLSKISNSLEEIYKSYILSKNHPIYSFINQEIYLLKEGYRGQVRTRSTSKFCLVWNNWCESIFLNIFQIKNYEIPKIEAFILSYIYLRNIGFYEVIQESYIFSGDLEDIFSIELNEEIEDEKTVIYKTIEGIEEIPQQLKKNKKKCETKKMKIVIPLYHTDLLKLFKLSKYDTSLLRKTYHLYNYSVFKKLKEDDQKFFNNFIQEEMDNNIQVFQTPKDEEAFPWIAKDVVKVINEMIYPKYGPKDELENMVIEYEKEYYHLLHDLNEEDHFFIGYFMKTGYITNFIAKGLKLIEDIKEKFRELNKRKELLKISSFVFLILKNDVGKKLLFDRPKFAEVVQKKKIELLQEIERYQKEGDENDYSYIIQILRE